METINVILIIAILAASRLFYLQLKSIKINSCKHRTTIIEFEDTGEITSTCKKCKNKI